MLIGCVIFYFILLAVSSFTGHWMQILKQERFVSAAIFLPPHSCFSLPLFSLFNIQPLPFSLGNDLRIVETVVT